MTHPASAGRGRSPRKREGGGQQAKCGGSSLRIVLQVVITARFAKIASWHARGRQRCAEVGRRAPVPLGLPVQHLPG